MKEKKESAQARVLATAAARHKTQLQRENDICTARGLRERVLLYTSSGLILLASVRQSVWMVCAVAGMGQSNQSLLPASALAEATQCLRAKCTDWDSITGGSAVALEERTPSFEFGSPGRSVTLNFWGMSAEDGM